VQDDRHKAAAEKLKMPAKAELDAVAGKSERHKKAIALVVDRKNWAAGLKKIDERLGMFVEAPDIEVRVLESDDPTPAKGGGQDGKGAIVFNVKRMVEHFARLDQIAEAKRYGKEARWVIPPAKLEDLVHHELVHCFAGTFSEAWLTEGLASWVAGDESIVWDYAYRDRPVNPLDQMVKDEDAYGRGWAFLEWMKSLGGNKLNAFLKGCLKDRQKVRKIAEEVAGKTWAELVLEERDWSVKFFNGYRDRIEK
jgi:hypothetical protein